MTQRSAQHETQTEQVLGYALCNSAAEGSAELHHKRRRALHTHRSMSEHSDNEVSLRISVSDLSLQK